MSELRRIYRAGETMPVRECRYCHGSGTLKNVSSSAWTAPKLIRVRCTHKVGDPYGFALERKRQTKLAWSVCVAVASLILILFLLFGGQN